ncbi:MAG TPA: hypothetical protein VFK07_03735 [Candidatus Paceibacterota bacterium]|nr:hypothetical protein [Candidatus Paceibacterota bacterium]
MIIVKKYVGIALLLVLFSVSTTAPAHASVLDWSNGADEAVSSQNWSFDSIYQSLQNLLSNNNDDQIVQSNISNVAVAPVNSPALKARPVKAKAKTMTVLVTAYSSTPDQTDSSPFITADGSYVHDGIVAANFLPFGTVIKIPEIFGDKIFVVEDRMNKRFSDRVDVWFPNRNLAKQFGAQKLTIEIVS